MAEFSERLKVAMELRGLRASDLSRRTGVNRGDICHYLKGDYKAKQNTLFEIAKVLNVDIAWLMGISDDMHDFLRSSIVDGDTVTMTSNASTEMEMELIKILRSLPFKEKVNLMNFAYELEERNGKSN